MIRTTRWCLTVMLGAAYLPDLASADALDDILSAPRTYASGYEVGQAVCAGDLGDLVQRARMAVHTDPLRYAEAKVERKVSILHVVAEEWYRRWSGDRGAEMFRADGVAHVVDKYLRRLHTFNGEPRARLGRLSFELQVVATKLEPLVWSAAELSTSQLAPLRGFVSRVGGLPLGIDRESHALRAAVAAQAAYLFAFVKHGNLVNSEMLSRALDALHLAVREDHLGYGLHRHLLAAARVARSLVEELRSATSVDHVRGESNLHQVLLYLRAGIDQLTAPPGDPASGRLRPVRAELEAIARGGERLRSYYPEYDRQIRALIAKLNPGAKVD